MLLSADVVLSVAQAQQSASALFARAEESFAEGDFAEALALFVQARDAGSSGPAVEYNIGVCQYRLGRYTDSEATFRRLAARFPAMRDLARYNIGLALTRQGQSADALSYFESVERSEDPVLADLAAAMLSRTDAARAVDRAWSRYLDVAIGRDGNVALIEDSVLPTGRSNSSPFAEVLAFASGRAGAAARWRIDLSGYGVTYTDAAQFNQIAVSAAGLREVMAGAWTLDVGPRLLTGTLDGDGFERRVGAVARLQHDLSATALLRIRFEQDDVSSIDDRFDYVSGDRQLAEVAYVHTAGGRRLQLSFAIESNDRASASVSPDRERIAVTYRFRPLQDWGLEAGLVYRRSDFDELLFPRHEKLTELSLVARHDLETGWQLSAALEVADNAANDPAFDYSRSRVSVGINRGF